jgi:hypothetical protein
MKNTVDVIIQSLTKEEFREFKYFLGRRNNSSEEREDLKVLTMIRNGEGAPVENIPAYRQTKNRIKAQLEFFVEFENIKRDPISRIQNYIEAAKFLFYKNLHTHGWDYLRKAERLAEEMEEYGLLDHIYAIQISYTYNVAVSAPKELMVPRLLEKRKKNLSLSKTEGNANAANALLIHEIRRLFSEKLSANSANIEQLVNTILVDYELNDLPKERIRIYCKIVNIVCRGLRENRDYHNMKVYGINGYTFIKKKKMLNKVPVNYIMDLLDGICIAALRSKDYASYEKYQIIYAGEAQKLKAHPDEYSYYDFVPNIDAADLYLCTNKLKKAKESLMVIYKKYHNYHDSIRIYFLLRANLLAVSFAGKEYSLCVKLYHEIMNQDKRRILSEPGFRLDLIIYTELFGAIFYYENDDPDHAWHLLKGIKRKYAETLMLPESGREMMFIKVMEKMINDPSYKSNRSFVTECKSVLKMKEFVPGDNEYISLNAWLNSKLTGEDYYQCFLKLVN